MTYRVINLSTGEIVAELGTSQFDIAKELADKLATEVGHREIIGVVEMVTRYETPLAGANRAWEDDSNEDSQGRRRPAQNQ